MADELLPYKPKTRQQQGADTEKKILKQMGARQHPRSGAGRVKMDGSTEDHLVEVKDANKTFVLNGEDLARDWVRAVRQGKDAIWMIKFANGICAEIHINRER